MDQIVNGLHVANNSDIRKQIEQKNNITCRYCGSQPSD